MSFSVVYLIVWFLGTLVASVALTMLAKEIFVRLFCAFFSCDPQWLNDVSN